MGGEGGWRGGGGGGECNIRQPLALLVLHHGPRFFQSYGKEAKSTLQGNKLETLCKRSLCLVAIWQGHPRDKGGIGMSVVTRAPWPSPVALKLTHPVLSTNPNGVDKCLTTPQVPSISTLCRDPSFQKTSRIPEGWLKRMGNQHSRPIPPNPAT